jgi:hypothetical protein
MKLSIPKPTVIVALCIISESEIAKVIPDYSCSLEQEKTEEFRRLLYSLGMDTSKIYSRQDAVQHRNRFNEVVVCSRWVGEERVDKQWISSGYASKEARDKASGSKILESLYRERCLTEDAQQMLEQRDNQSRK